VKTFGDLKAWLLRTKAVESIVAELHSIGHADDEPLTDEHLERLDAAMHPREPDEPTKTDDTAPTGDAKTADQPGSSTSQSSQPAEGGTPPGEASATDAAPPSPPTLNDEVKPA